MAYFIPSPTSDNYVKKHKEVRLNQIEKCPNLCIIVARKVRSGYVSIIRVVGVFAYESVEKPGMVHLRSSHRVGNWTNENLQVNISGTCNRYYVSRRNRSLSGLPFKTSSTRNDVCAEQQGWCVPRDQEVVLHRISLPISSDDDIGPKKEWTETWPNCPESGCSNGRQTVS